MPCLAQSYPALLYQKGGQRPLVFQRKVFHEAEGKIESRFPGASIRQGC